MAVDTLSMAVAVHFISPQLSFLDVGGYQQTKRAEDYLVTPLVLEISIFITFLVFGEKTREIGQQLSAITFPYRNPLWISL